MTACVFCTDNNRGQIIVSRQLLFQTTHWNVLLDHKPVVYGHLILSPKEHRRARIELTQEETADLYQVQQRIHTIFRKTFQSDWNLQYEKNVGWGIPHFRIHVLPSSSFMGFAWLQVKLFSWTFIPPYWSLSPDQLRSQAQAFLLNEQKTN